ncbi:MAG TPA: NAD(P)-dependent alcohol dehydrogenase [Streptosporangiaceae bacterium]|jgi:NADPH:quinone reductase-like Zn-dependent oxidoreductase
MKTAAAQDRPPAQAATMQAIVQDRYGEARDVLRLEETERPEVGDGEVLLRVDAAGVDRGVWHLMTGLPYPVRLAGYGVRAPSTRIRGREVAGRVEAAGKDVTAFQVGDEVFGIAEGTFAGYACAQPGKLARRPDSLTAAQAAAVPVSALTALQAVRDYGHVQAGQKVLVIGASGGVGTYAVQIARAYGAEVTGLCSTAKMDLVQSIGADHVLDYTRTDIADGAHRYDVIIDTGGNRTLRQLRGALTPRGTLVIVGGETSGRWIGGFDRALRAPVVSRFVSQQLTAVMVAENAADLVVLAGLLESGQVTPVVDRTYPLSQAADAVRHMQEGRARGKVVITI